MPWISPPDQLWVRVYSDALVSNTYGRKGRGAGLGREGEVECRSPDDSLNWQHEELQEQNELSNVCHLGQRVGFYALHQSIDVGYLKGSRPWQSDFLELINPWSCWELTEFPAVETKNVSVNRNLGTHIHALKIYKIWQQVDKNKLGF